MSFIYSGTLHKPTLNRKFNFLIVFHLSKNVNCNTSCQFRTHPLKVRQFYNYGAIGEPEQNVARPQQKKYASEFRFNSTPSCVGPLCFAYSRPAECTTLIKSVRRRRIQNSKFRPLARVLLRHGSKKKVERKFDLPRQDDSDVTQYAQK